ncbi:MAG: lysophospholipid acyltransferase family protein [Bacteroidota bacterium]
MIHKLTIGLLKIISMLPFSFWYFLSDILYFPAKWFYRRKVVVGNIRALYPKLSDKEINKIADDFYRNFCDLIVELFKSLSVSKQKMRELAEFVNPEIIDQTNGSDKEFLMYSIHNGNWEWLALGCSAGSEYPCSPIVQKQSSGFADQFMKHIRSRFGGVAIPKSNAARFIVRNKAEKMNIGILADQSPPFKQPKYWVNFMGKETAFINGLSQLPYLAQLPCYFARYRRVKRGRYQIEFVKIGEPPYQKGDLDVLRNYVKESEALIKSDPSQYLWSHRRWKYERQENEEMTKL